METMNKKCIALYSGGLDSLLAVKIMKDLGFDVVPLFVETPFNKKDIPDLQKQLEPLGLNITVKADYTAYIDMLINPRFGYGKNLNPCVDCKIFFYKMAKQLMEEVDASFVITGEVLGQRPMSQRSYTVLRTIEKHAGLKDLVLRPLSAKCLPETKMEQSGMVDRSKLYCITGRSRKAQFELAKKMGIASFESPAGGCMLTDQNFSKRLKELMQFKDELYNETSLKLLYVGRHFRINGVKFILSRNEAESNQLKAFNLPKIRCTDSPCAIGLFTKKPDSNTIEMAAAIFKRYSKKAKTIVYEEDKIAKQIEVQPATKETIEKFRVGG